LTVPHFGAVAPLLAGSDMIATLPTIVLADAMKRFGLEARNTPFAVQAMKQALAWSTRLTNDPGSVWLRGCFSEAFLAQLRQADHIL
jgi:DNA-binding transcriptional LysR family regulator